MRPPRDDTWMLPWLGAMTLVLVWTACVHAHVERGQATGFVTGFGHPWSGFDHVLAMIAVGIWGAQLGTPAVWLLPVVFPMVMAQGAFLGLIGLPLPGVETGIALSALLLVRECAAPALLLGSAEATQLRGGQNCAKDPVRVSNNCYLREQQGPDGYTYRCDGNEPDWDCPLASTDTNNYCATGQATCRGNQFYWDDVERVWQPDGSCRICTYQTARLQQMPNGVACAIYQQ